MNSTTQNKRLTRSRDDRFIGGVAAGIATRLNIDPAIVRIGFVISIIFGGLGVLAYLILLAAVPIEGDPAEPAPQPEGSKRLWVIGGTVAMGILALVSIGVTGDGFGGWMFGFAQGFWFGALIWALMIGGVYWLLQQSKDPDAPSPKAPAVKTPDVASQGSDTVAPSPTQNAPAPPAAPSSLAAPTSPAAPVAAGMPAAFASGTGSTPESEAPTTEAPRTAETKVQPAPATSSDGPSTFGKIMTVIAIILAAGFTALLLGVISVASTTVFGAIPMATIVIALGIGLVIAALNNRHQLALWTLGAAVAIAIPMAIVSIADLRIDGDFGEIREKPVVADSIPGDGYQLAAGAMTIDMRNYPFREGQTVDLPVESGLGATRVIVPDDVCVSGSVDAKAGMSEIRGLQTSGVGFDRTFGDDLSKSAVLHVDSEMKVGLFLVVDDTTFRDSGRNHNDEDTWGGTIDEPDLQDEAQNRALKACDGVDHQKSTQSAPQKPAKPAQPEAPSPAGKKSAA